MSRYRIGMAHYLMGEYAAAISVFSDALAIAPQSDDMYIAALRKTLLARPGFWFSFSFLAAYTDAALHTA